MFGYSVGFGLNLCCFVFGLLVASWFVDCLLCYFGLFWIFVYLLLVGLICLLVALVAGFAYYFGFCVDGRVLVGLVVWI